MPKLLTFVIPCFNSQDYMLKAVETLLPSKDQIEILIVDDGSSDNTFDIAKKLESEYPGVIHAIHEENKGHGGAIMTGIKFANAPYFKVLDSDDWVDSDILKKILDVLSEFVHHNAQVDLVVSNFIYDKAGQKRKKIMRYASLLPQGKIFGWDEVKRFPKGRYILMHSVIYRTQLLRDCNINLPDHTFYVDNLFVYVPMAKVNTMYYLDLDFYHYFIGRDDQSVHESVMIKRIDQQIYVNKLMLKEVNIKDIKNPHKEQYMFNYLEIITIISSVLLTKSGTKENLDKKAELWKYIYNQDKEIYRKLRYGAMGRLVNLKGTLGRKITIKCYILAQKFVGFN